MRFLGGLAYSTNLCFVITAGALNSLICERIWFEGSCLRGIVKVLSVLHNSKSVSISSAPRSIESIVWALCRGTSIAGASFKTIHPSAWVVELVRAILNTQASCNSLEGVKFDTERMAEAR